jgi:WD40 repeat protein
LLGGLFFAGLLGVGAVVALVVFWEDICRVRDGDPQAGQAQQATLDAEVLDLTTELQGNASRGEWQGDPPQDLSPEQAEIVTDLERVFGIAFSPDGRQVAVVDEHAECRVWDPVTGKLIYAIHRKADAVGSPRIMYAPTTRHLVLNRSRSHFELHETHAGKSARSIEYTNLSLGGNPCDIAPNGKLMAIIKADKIEFRKLPSGDLAPIPSIDIEIGDDCTCFRFGSSRYLLLGLRKADQFGRPAKVPAVAVHDLRGRLAVRELASLSEFRSPELQFSPDRRLVFQASGSWLLAGPTAIVDWEKDECVLLWQPPKVLLYSLCLTTDNKTLIVGKNDGALDFLAFPSGKLIRSVPVAPQTTVFDFVEASPDGRILAAHSHKKMHFWSLPKLLHD